MEDVQRKLTKALGTKEIFSIAAGAMISSGLFVLPAVVYSKAGPSIILSYIFAGLLMIPAVLSKVELATAMPKSGGTYFFIHRSMGPLFGTFAGFASWFSLSLKSAFALVGIGVIIDGIFRAYPGPSMMVKIIGIGFTLLFAILNILSVKKSGRLQVLLVFGLIAILLFYIFTGLNHIDVHRYVPFKPQGWRAILTVTGMVFISYGGLTKVASVAEEVKSPGKTIPRGMFSAFVIVTLLYVLTVFVTVGLLTRAEFSATLIPISLGASMTTGGFGYILLVVAAAAAFITTANAGLLSASRVPLAMAKDNLIPRVFSKISYKRNTPVASIIFTALFMILVIIFLDLESLVKVASTMMLLLFMFVNLSVIIMRESRLVSYKPDFKSPGYPITQIIGIVLYLTLISQMGRIPLLLTLSFIAVSVAWFFFYSKSRSKRESALIHIVERVTSKEMRTSTITDELREILIERDEIAPDRFDRIVENAVILDIQEKTDAHGLFHILADIFAQKFNLPCETLFDLLVKREAESTTAIHDGLAIPHIIVDGNQQFEIIIVRSKQGIQFGEDVPPVNIVFALSGTRDERNFHLKALMAIAQLVQNTDFVLHWMKAGNVEELRNLILLSERVRKGEL
jgi:amino acid transporter/mannitol/fructose-specific phosphotransferase system IIA component (Ntr-type)